MSAVPRVGVVGAGSTGLALAVDLALRGAPVETILEADAGLRARLCARPAISFAGRLGSGAVPMPAIVSSPARLAECNLVVVATTADRHAEVARELGPLLRPGRRVVLATGYAGGASAFAAAAGLPPASGPGDGEGDRGFGRDGDGDRDAHDLPGGGAPDGSAHPPGASVLAFNTTPHLAYAPGDGGVHITAVKTWLEVSGRTEREAREGADALAALFPPVRAAADQLASSLNNPNPVAHVPALLVGMVVAARERAGRIPPGGAFHLGDHGSAELESIRAGMEEERREVFAALGLAHRFVGRQDFAAAAYGPGSRETDPPRIGPTFQERFLHEDVPFGLVPLEALGALAGLETPLLTALVDVIDAAHGTDSRAVGRSLDAFRDVIPASAPVSAP